MKSIYFSILLGALVALGTCQKCHLREMDLCMASVAMYMRDPVNAIPENEAGIDKQCVNIRETQSCLRNFTTQCTTPIQREIIELVIVTPMEAVDDYCNEGGSLRGHVVKHSACLREVASSTEFRACVSDVQAALDLLDKPVDDLYMFGCCAFTRFRSCVESIVESQCGKDVVDIATSLADTSSGHLFTRFCGCLDDDGDDCSKVLPESGTKPQGRASKSPLAKFLATFLPS